MSLCRRAVAVSTYMHRGTRRQYTSEWRAYCSAIFCASQYGSSSDVFARSYCSLLVSAETPDCKHTNKCLLTSFSAAPSRWPVFGMSNATRQGSFCAAGHGGSVAV